MKGKHSSRIPQFRHQDPHTRRETLSKLLELEPNELDEALTEGFSEAEADKLIENVIGRYAFPFGIATNFVINGKEVLVPMVIEEPSVVAAASNAAKIARAGSGFVAEATEPIMIGQILFFTKNPEALQRLVEENMEHLLDVAARADEMLLRVGGGPRKIEFRPLGPADDGEFAVAVHLLVDVRDAMGANAVNTMAEAVGNEIERIGNEHAVMRILSNLADQRLVRASVKIPFNALAFGEFGGERVATGIVNAYKLAAIDPYRAATHNKGIMNGIDAVVIATGNDWRAVEAGAHAYAAQDGRYKPLTRWWITADDELAGELTIPMAVGIVGGAVKVHAGARMALKILGVESASELACVIASVGLASNMAALRALSTEGIQRGHMRLHSRSRSLQKE